MLTEGKCAECEQKKYYSKASAAYPSYKSIMHDNFLTHPERINIVAAASCSTLVRFFFFSSRSSRRHLTWVVSHFLWLREENEREEKLSSVLNNVGSRVEQPATSCLSFIEL